ncbi:outer membrane protein [Bradyrhizobium sp. GCM10027634]|uniref:outer membrane protein n=1 Tax=unclassified Bradyrhizobium TaxID=2631580 RepID=UPI00188B83FB|nr:MULTISPECIES: outer membrane protein [unclassified Bradyrhizobium]MDN5002055.1 porin family protein [Bradyrhizobium sp. WYCCWR 12677]QOZ45673.1 porin family protein [Bradyrhizobium sp. CCBAU 53340]
MKTKLAAAALLLASTSLSFAADLAVKAPYAPAAVWSWTGFYLGGHVGAGWGTTESTVTSFTGAVPGLPAGVVLSQNDRSGFLGGGQFGYNWQSGWAVFGVQGDITGMDVKGTAPCLGALSCSAKSDWLATVTGRIGGVVADRTLVYAKGGAAWMHTNNTLSVPGVLSVSADSTNVGWLLGLGAEYAFDHNWSAFIEYNYIDFDKKSIAMDFSGLAGAPSTANVDVKNKLSIAKIGVNYKFGGPVVAKY